MSTVSGALVGSERAITVDVTRQQTACMGKLTLLMLPSRMRVLAALSLGLVPQPTLSFLPTPRVALRPEHAPVPRLAPLTSEKPPWMAAGSTDTAGQDTISQVIQACNSNLIRVLHFRSNGSFTVLYVLLFLRALP